MFPKIKAIDAFEAQIVDDDFIIPGFLAGSVGALVAPGATGKSFFAMQLACMIADETAETNKLGLKVDKRGAVHYISFEDPASQLVKRLSQIGKDYSQEAKLSIDRLLTIHSAIGKSFDLMSEEAVEHLIKETKGARLIIIDTLSRVNTLDENNNNEMAQLLTKLDAICQETGASLMFLHHTSKAAAMNGQGGLAQASRGASSLIDNARWCGNLVRMSQNEAKKYSIEDADISNYIKFEMPKINYDKNQSEVWYKREEGGVLSALTLSSKAKGLQSQDASNQNRESSFKRKQNAL